VSEDIRGIASLQHNVFQSQTAAFGVKNGPVPFNMLTVADQFRRSGCEQRFKEVLSPPSFDAITPRALRYGRSNASLSSFTAVISRRFHHADVAPRRNAGLVLRYDSIAATGAGLGVALLDQKPVVWVPPSAHAHKSPTPVKPFSFQLELERTMFVGFDGIPPFGIQVPRSQISTVPAPYSPRGITPSKSAYSSG
jgi:hypothetical protein